MSAYGQKRTSERGIATLEWTTNILAAMRILTAVLVVALAACAGSPVRIGMMDPEDLIEVPTSSLCYDYVTFNNHDAKIRPELERRNIFTPREWEAIDQRRIFIGMSELAFQCSWPAPFIFDTDSVYVSKEGPWGERAVSEYGLGVQGGLPEGADVIPGEWPKRVYIENGVIVAFQEASAVRESDCVAFRKRKCFDFDGLVSTKVSDALLPL